MPTAKTAEKLTTRDVGFIDELKRLGWTVDPDVQPYKAFEKDGDLREIGPAASIKALHTQVMIAVGKTHKVGSSKLEGGEFKDNGKPGSQPILTGTEDAVFEDLMTAGREYRLNTLQILTLQTLQATQKKTLDELMKKFADALTVDEEENEKYFTVEVEGTLTDIVLAVEEKEVLKTRIHKD